MLTTPASATSAALQLGSACYSRHTKASRLWFTKWCWLVAAGVSSLCCLRAQYSSAHVSLPATLFQPLDLSTAWGHCSNIGSCCWPRSFAHLRLLLSGTQELACTPYNKGYTSAEVSVTSVPWRLRSDSLSLTLLWFAWGSSGKLVCGSTRCKTRALPCSLALSLAARVPLGAICAADGPTTVRHLARTQLTQVLLRSHYNSQTSSPRADHALVRALCPPPSTNAACSLSPSFTRTSALPF